MRTGTVSVNCSVYTAGQMMTETEKSSDLGEISVVTMRLGSRIAAERLFNAHFQSFVELQYRYKTKSAIPTWCSLSYSYNARPNKILKNFEVEKQCSNKKVM